MALGSRKGEDSPIVAQNEYATQQQQRPRRGGVKRHCARCWWLYLLVVLIILLVVVLLVIFVGLPHIAQSKINDAQMSVEGITLRNTQTDNYTMSINSTIRTDGSVHATIDGFPAELYLEDLPDHTPFAVVQFPSTTSDALVTVNVTDQFINVTDQHAFAVFNTWLLVNETLNVTVSGDTYVHVNGISKAFSVHFQKTINMPGLRLLEGTQVIDSQINLSGDSSGNNFNGTVVIPNYSLITFELGNTSFYNYLLGQDIGTVYIDNVNLVAQTNNSFFMAANISQTPVLSALTQQPYCSNGGDLPFQLRGKTVVNHGQPLAYYADALAAANQSVTIPIGADLKKLGLPAINCSST